MLKEAVFRYVQHTFPFFNNFFKTFRKCWSDFLWILPKEDSKMFVNLAQGIPSVHAFCSTDVIPTPSFLSLNPGGRHRLHKTQEKILTGLDYRFQSSFASLIHHGQHKYMQLIKYTGLPHLDSTTDFLQELFKLA